MKLKTSKADQLFQRGFAAHQAGRLEDAQKTYRQALRYSPSDIEILYLLGTALAQLGKGEEAIKYLKKTLKLKPDYPEALNNLGLVLSEVREFKEAVTHFKRALALRAEYPDALNNLGSTLRQLENLDEAELYVRRALQLNPSYANAHYNLGLTLRDKDLFEEAVLSFLRGIELESNFAPAYEDLGSIYRLWGRLRAALTYFDHAIALRPDSYSALNNRGAILEEMGKHEEALAAYEQAILSDPKRMIAPWNKAFLFLKQGILNQGWEAHEFRLSRGESQFSFDRFPFPTWDGSSLEDKTILIYAEQGLGDEIFFASCFQDVINQTKRCVIECAPRLTSLFARSFPMAIIQGAERSDINWLFSTPKIDLQIAAGSLPRLLRPSLECFSRTPSYLVADPQRIGYWRSRLAALGPGLKIGICWRSSLTEGHRNRYYSSLNQWGNIFRVSGVHFINIQYDECSEELQEAQDSFDVNITVYPELDLRNDIDESAALIASLDLVISAGTATCEISAALGISTWRCAGQGLDPMDLGTDHSPWHPTMQTFKQPAYGDWNTPLSLIAEALSERVMGSVRIIEYTKIAYDVELAVDSSLEHLPSYILKEQCRWFDPEYEFVLRMVGPGMRVVDVGAGIGAYAIPLTKKNMTGYLWALTQTATETNLLMQSRQRNHLEGSFNISIASQDLSLDAELNRYGLDNIDLIRVSVELSSPDLFKNSTQFFSINSPLVMLGIKPDDGSGIELANHLMENGYGLYRLIPGLDFLVPFISTDELDSFSLNLFACKPGRAESLEGRGLLIRRLQTLESLPGIDLSYWRDYLRVMPYSRDRIDEWFIQPQNEQGWEVYWMALNLFTMAKSEHIPSSQRYSCLQSAGDIMATLLQEHANIPRLLTGCRVLTDLGKQEEAVSLLNKILSLLDSGETLPLNEPFLALTDTHALMDPGDRFPEWLVSMTLQQREWLRTFSSFLTDHESLPILKEIQSSGFGSEEVDRRIMLIKRRFRLD